MTTLLLVAMLFTTAYHDVVSCTVQGTVWKLGATEPLDFRRADSCVGVKVTFDEKQLVMYSPNIWVAVVIPPEYGHRPFQYRWMSEYVHIGRDTFPITGWGYVEKG